uniref:Uncharacterized protein n=1 Tax=Streptomyces sp. NBC_00008 TaxID=2903610 RepID=A0AAU2VQU4_9ACTN
MTPTEAAFLPGLELSRILYEEAVRPVLDAAFPGLPYAAARIGPGSEVLGFDTVRSADHDWGPRLDLFLVAEDVAAHGGTTRRLLADRLPKEIRGRPTHFRPADDPLDPVGHMAATDGPVPYHGRPFLVLHAERFARPLAASVTDPELRGRPLTGSVDQWADSTDLLTGAGGEALRAAEAATARG